jgi:hypothetical protein
MVIPLWLYAVVVVALCVALGVVCIQRDRARYALTDHLAQCTAPANDLEQEAQP